MHLSVIVVVLVSVVRSFSRLRIVLASTLCARGVCVSKSHWAVLISWCNAMLYINVPCVFARLVAVFVRLIGIEWVIVFSRRVIFVSLVFKIGQNFQRILSYDYAAILHALDAVFTHSTTWFSTNCDLSLFLCLFSHIHSHSMYDF